MSRGERRAERRRGVEGCPVEMHEHKPDWMRGRERETVEEQIGEREGEIQG